MRVLLDENFPIQLYRRLQQAGYEAEHIMTLGLRGQSDDEIRLRLANEPDLVFLTQDTEFAERPADTVATVMISRVPRPSRSPGASSCGLHVIDDFLRHPVPGQLFEVLPDGRVVGWEFGTRRSRPNSRSPVFLGPVRTTERKLALSRKGQLGTVRQLGLWRGSVQDPERGWSFSRRPSGYSAWCVALSRLSRRHPRRRRPTLPPWQRRPRRRRSGIRHARLHCGAGLEREGPRTRRCRRHSQSLGQCSVDVTSRKVGSRLPLVPRKPPPLE